MRPSGYYICPHLTLGKFWVWDAWPTQTCRSKRTYRLKWEVAAHKIVKKDLCSNVLLLFREISECTADIEVKWQLFKAVAASSAARTCGQKQLGLANTGRKVTLWWNQEVKHTIRPKEVASRHSFRNKRLFLACAVHWGAKCMPSAFKKDNTK